MSAIGKILLQNEKEKSSTRIGWIGIVVALGLIGVLLAPSFKQLSFNVWVGAIASGFAFAFVALGVYITFNILNYPDLTIDGSLPLGAAITATMLTAGYNAYVTLPVAIFAGALAGVATALIATRLHIHSLLASILTTTALISVNLRIMGRSNIPLLNHSTIFTPFSAPFRNLLQLWGGNELAKMSRNLLVIVMVGILVVIVKLLFDWFMHTELGMAMRATGDNPQMVRALGTDTDKMVILGLAISNGLVGLSGAIIAQYQGFADINMGVGLIIAGLAAVILGETFFKPKSIAMASVAVIAGMIIYRVAIAAALTASIPLPGGEILRIEAQDVKLATAVLVLIALWFTRVQKKKG